MKMWIEPNLDRLLTFAWYLSKTTTLKPKWLVRFDEGIAALIWANGNISIEGVVVPLRFQIAADWVTVAPRVWCDSPWLRRETAWHVYNDGELCWVHPGFWRDVLARLQRVLEDHHFTTTAAYWLVEHSAELIWRHLKADRVGIQSWPESWSEWAHSGAGTKEYRQAKANGIVERTVHRLSAIAST